MQKLRILLFEVIGLGILIAWLMWKYPELIDDIIPWVALAIAWHVTWEFVLDTETVKSGAATLGRRTKKMWIWPLVFLLGGGVSVLYWVGINKGLKELAFLAAKHKSHDASAQILPTPKPAQPQFGGASHEESTRPSGPPDHPKIHHYLSKQEIRTQLLNLSDELHQFTVDRRRKWMDTYSNLADQKALMLASNKWEVGTAQEFDVKYKPKVVSLLIECKRLGVEDLKLNSMMAMSGTPHPYSQGTLADWEIRTVAEHLTTLAAKLQDTH